MNYAIPSYICSKQTSGVAPFGCTAEIGGIQYIGAAARTKKDAEIKAARTALLAIQGNFLIIQSRAIQYAKIGSGLDWVINGQCLMQVYQKVVQMVPQSTLLFLDEGRLRRDKRRPETPKSLKVKKSGGKKNWNNRKFLRKTDQIVDAEKDGAREAGDVHDSDVPMQATITEEPSKDSIMLHPEEEARIVEQELLRDMTMLQADKEARSVKQGLPMLQHHEEAKE